MINRILQKLGYVKISDRNRYIDDLKSEIRTINALLKVETDKNKRLSILDVNVGDPSPIDTEQRKEYVARVAGLHKDILQPKIKQMISSIYKDMEFVENSRETDLILKGVIYALKEIDNWANLMISEHVAYVRNENPSTD